ncbi:competence protein, ComEC family [Campylobacter hyointestinalis subsp. lawsonii CCUG 27631]|uniref:ComEC/Rec2 family competence protein n=1 Tax=Campylobacter hyointestinalis TaxID=198 RepID=UPI0007C884A0|nr:ComEC/Rec2 family competence protein [Campylobacter hyointestinalis]ANE34087.1 competence protein, ComEC family [Campylobacter hyointestinalis subsp. lawsonii CCUG 27631]
MVISESKTEILVFVIFCVFVFLCNVGYEFFKFKQFTQKSHQFLNVKVEQSYTKEGKNAKTYNVLRLNAGEFSFYTTLKSTQIDITDKKYLKIGVITKNLDFVNYIKHTFYLPNFKIIPIDKEPNLKDKLVDFIAHQHEIPKLKELYSALFFATAISKELRRNITNWGVAHIVSISGFHLGLLFGFLFFILKPIYKIAQNNHFPYRNANFDITFAILILMFGYLWLLDFTPSFLRSLIMACICFILLSFGLKVFNFTNLFLTIAIALSFNPSLIFSIGFYFSCLGVFFIFLYIHHFGDKKDLTSKTKMALHTLYLEIFVFSAMNIPVYYFFSSASFYQLSVIPLGYIFVVFYPMSIILHIFGYGGLLDEYMLSFLNLAYEQTKIEVPTWLFICFNVSLLFSIKFKKLALLVAFVGMALFMIPLTLASF